MIHATIDTFEEEVIKLKGLVLVDFCGVSWGCDRSGGKCIYYRKNTEGETHERGGPQL